eukprot:Hpha_TRINITY_DN15532_c0_g1::TRINITY_DN15532_c0_g1_i2::g.109035::m.109035
MRRLHLTLLTSLVCSASAEDFTVTGFVIDMYCWNKPNHIGIDGTAMDIEPGNHWLHCMTCCGCPSQGFAVMEQDSASGKYAPKYLLSSSAGDIGSTMTTDLVTAEMSRAGDRRGLEEVTVTGTLQSSGSGLPTLDPSLMCYTPGPQNAQGKTWCHDSAGQRFEKDTGSTSVAPTTTGAPTKSPTISVPTNHPSKSPTDLVPTNPPVPPPTTPPSTRPPTAPVTLPPTPLCSPSGKYASGCMQTLHDVEMHWLVDAGNSLVSFFVDYPHASGWAAFGLPKQNRRGVECAMTDADIVWADGDNTVGVWHSTTCTIPTNQSAQLPSAVATRNNGRTQLEFTRGLANLSASGTAVSLSGPMTWIFAYDRQTAVPSYHNDFKRWTVTIDLSASPGANTVSPTAPRTAAPVITRPSASPSTSPLAPPTSACAAPSPPNGYACVSNEDAQLKLFWTVRQDGAIDLRLQRAGNGEGWIALGFGTGMLGSKAFVAQGGGGAGTWWSIGNSYETSAISSLGAAENPIQFESGTVTVDAQGLALDLLGVTSLSATDARLVWSYQVTGSFPQNPHLASTRAARAFNFLTGQATTTTEDKVDMVKLHAGLLLTAWCYLCPVAIIAKAVPRLFSGAMVAGMPLAFVLHAGLMGLVYLFTIVGVVIAAIEFEGQPGKGHGRIGVVVLLLASLQVAGGIFRPANATPQLPKRTWFNRIHRMLAGALLILSGVNVFTGADYYEKTYDPDQIYTVAAIIGLAVLYVLLCIGSVLQAQSNKKAAEAKAGQTQDMEVKQS